MKIIRLYDRSRTTTDWQCPRKRYWQYEHDGKGIVTGNTSLELYLGTTLHDGLAAIAHQQRQGAVDIDLIGDTARGQMVQALLNSSDGELEDFNFANEQAALVEGLLRGFYKQVWTRLMEQYPTILLIEPEMQYHHGTDGKKLEGEDLSKGFLFMAKPDLVLVDREGCVVYFEYKSTSSKREEWVNSWDTAVQLHSTIRAIEATTGAKVTNVVVQGLYKGYESYGKQSSPFCYAYHRAGSPPFVQEETLYEYRAGFKRVPTWELEGGVKRWVENMPEAVLATQFPQTPPIFIKEGLIDNFFRQRAARETEIHLAKSLIEFAGDDEESKRGIMDMAFPQRFDQCYPSYGKPCMFRQLCHGRVENPLTAGFIYREPHHALELEMQQEEPENAGTDNL